MEFLFSKIPPTITHNRNFSEAFENLLVPSNYLKIATGYISEESLMELKAILDFYKGGDSKKNCDLVIGMHGREGFTKPQYEAARDLGEFLEINNLGDVRLCTAFKFHGKVYSFFKDNSHFASIMGSSNLTDIVEAPQYEVDCIFTDDESLRSLEVLHENLIKNASKKLLELEPPSKFLQNNNLLEGRIGVERVGLMDYQNLLTKKTNLVFKIPLKAEPKSNLNAFFGKGRLSATGAIRPRPWYEVEVIVPKLITSLPGYPRNGTVFNVVTDDGWKFKCKVSGQNDKNLRSEDDLKTLGRWIKGRLEEAGVLKVGQLVTDEMLEKYGRHFLTLSQTKEPNTWLLDFSVN